MALIFSLLIDKRLFNGNSTLSNLEFMHVAKKMVNRLKCPFKDFFGKIQHMINMSSNKFLS